MKNKFVIGCVVVIVVFGSMSYVASRYQEEAKDNWTVFLSNRGIDRETIVRYAALTRNDRDVLDRKIGRADLEIKEALWGRYRYSDYWLSVLRTIVAIAAIPARTAARTRASPAKTSGTASRRVARSPARTTRANELSKNKGCGRKYLSKCLIPNCQFACTDAGAGGS